uniref:Mitochondrial fission 1 protein n=1 Tax=Mus spicilegus TaxID=10103 RepID=A0A8C6MTP0_MUSSI
MPRDEAARNFERKFQSEQAAGSVSKSTQFEYAWCLVRSKYNEDIRRGIVLLEELLPKGSKEEQRDYVFYLAVGNYRLKEYEKALKYVRGLLQTEPQNNQAKELERLIDKAMKKGDRPLVGCSSSSPAGPLGTHKHTHTHTHTHTESLIRPTLQGLCSPRVPTRRLWVQVPRFCGGECGQGPGVGLVCSHLPLPFPDGLVGMAIVGGMALGVAGLAGLIGLAVSKSKS